jgi:DNA-binding XRE family transcriptional regulator
MGCKLKNKNSTPHRRGSGNGNSKLTETNVQDIRHRHSKGEGQQKLAKIFGVSQSTIAAIISKRHWAWLKYEPPN